jgi:hypothetical protein
MVRKQACAGISSKAHRSSTTFTYGWALRRALREFVAGGSFADLTLHGNVGWKPTQLVVLAVLWVWSDQPTLTQAFQRARRLAERLFGTAAVTSYQGLCGALRSYTEPLLPQVWSRLQRLMEDSASSHWRIGKWLPLAVDGSRANTPRTRSNECAFCAPNFGRGATAKSRKRWKNRRRRTQRAPARLKPQIWLTLIWHMGLKISWCWKKGPSTASERHHLRELVEEHSFPKNTLFCGDAGFVGYELWKALLDGGHQLLVRVGGNVRLLRRLGDVRQRSDLVYLWPEATRRQGQPPLVLRLLSFQGPRGRIYLVTSVLSARELSPAQAARLYRLRWGVELQFRALKQTFGRGKLRSRTAENALLELDWSLVGLSLVQWFAVQEQIKIDVLPQHSSVALALRIIQEAMCNWSDVLHDRRMLARQLAAATQDRYPRHLSKRSRYPMAYKDAPTASKPKLLDASHNQRQAYQSLRLAA